MVQLLAVELIVLERRLAFDQLELRHLDEAPQCAAFHADRTVALQHLGEIGFGFEADDTAMTAFSIGLVWRARRYC